MKQGWIAENEVTALALENFLTKNGRQFYGLPLENNGKSRLRLEWKGERIPVQLKSDDGIVTIIPFMTDKEIYSARWISPDNR